MTPTRTTIPPPRWAVYVGCCCWGFIANGSYEDALAQAVHDVGTTGENVRVAPIRWVE